MGLLSHEEIKEKIKDIPGWQIDGQVLTKEFVFPTFTDAMVFVNEVAQTAEDMNHYPNIGIHANKVILRCHTSDLGGITDQDIAIVVRTQEAEKMIFGELSK